jgi:hypothetical protein
MMQIINLKKMKQFFKDWILTYLGVLILLAVLFCLLYLANIWLNFQIIFASTGIVSLVIITIGIWKSLMEYRLKLKAEARIAESTQIEADIKLIKHFTELMNIAHARGGYKISEKVIEEIFKNGVIDENDFQDLHKLNQKLEDAAILTLPVGVAAQDAAIASISVLAQKHEILKRPALQALETMKSFKGEIVQKYIEEINKKN